MMKASKKSSKIITIILLSAIVCVTVLAFVIPPLLTEKFDEELVIYNWADYMDLAILMIFQLIMKSLQVTV